MVKDGSKERNPKITKPHPELTTSQVSGLTLVGASSLYRYTRDFSNFFSPGAKQHKKGRRWTLDDLELIQAILTLHHQRVGTARISELLAEGWRVEFNPYYTRELIARLVEVTLSAYEETKEVTARAMAAIEESRRQSKAAEYNDRLFRELCTIVWDLQEGQKWVEKHMKLTGLIREAKKKGEWVYPEGMHLHPGVEAEKEKALGLGHEVKEKITKVLGQW